MGRGREEKLAVRACAAVVCFLFVRPCHSPPLPTSLPPHTFHNNNNNNNIIIITPHRTSLELYSDWLTTNLN